CEVPHSFACAAKTIPGGTRPRRRSPRCFSFRLFQGQRPCRAHGSGGCRGASIARTDLAHLLGLTTKPGGVTPFSDLGTGARDQSKRLLALKTVTCDQPISSSTWELVQSTHGWRSQAEARSRRSLRSRSLRVSEAARSNSTRASSKRPSLLRK